MYPGSETEEKVLLAKDLSDIFFYGCTKRHPCAYLICRVFQIADNLV
jgi:hypothetical protein